MDLDVIQTTPAEPDATKTMQAELNALRAEIHHGCRKKQKRDSKDKEPLKCYNCGELNHVARYCTAVKKEKKESGKAQDQ
jgi:hypothetical protein